MLWFDLYGIHLTCNKTCNILYFFDFSYLFQYVLIMILILKQCFLPGEVCGNKLKTEKITKQTTYLSPLWFNQAHFINIVHAANQGIVLSVKTRWTDYISITFHCIDWYCQEKHRMFGSWDPAFQRQATCLNLPVCVDRGQRKQTNLDWQVYSSSQRASSEVF